MNTEDKFTVRCGLCRMDLTTDEGKYLRWDAKWISRLAMWVCYYCQVGLQ